MANPLKDEEKIYEQIKNENITVHPLVWELINHHVRNDLNHVTVGLSLIYLSPPWILKTAGAVIWFLYKVSSQRGDPPANLEKICSVSIDHAQQIAGFLNGLRRATSPK